MRFSEPAALLLLLFLPLLAWVGWPRRARGRRRDILAVVLRLVITTCLVLALAGAELVRAADELAVIFALDVSDSVSPADQAAGLEWMQSAIGEMGPDDRAGLIVFGGNALVETPLSQPGLEFGPLLSSPDTGQTDLAGAIQLSSALFPSGMARRLVILSDGASTHGNAAAAARLAALNGIQILTVPVGSPPAAEVRVSEVRAPQRLLQGERFELQIGIESSQAAEVGVRVLAGGNVVFEGTQELRPGEQSFSLPLTAGEPGLTRYQVQIDPPDDRYYQNNELSAFSEVAGPPRILLIAPPEGERLPDGTPRPDESSALEQALLGAGYTVQRGLPVDVPSDLTSIVPYAAVVLVNTPARSLSTAQMETLQSYVRDLGGGLLAVGGPTSFGTGGYYRTPLEETLPVDMEIKDELRRPSLAMVFIIDRSGSMTDTSGGITKLELAKEAAARSVDLLFPGDRVGVIAFDETAMWVVPMTGLEDPAQVQNDIAGIESGGGTDIMAGLQAAARVLPDDPAKVKHILLLTDGGADPTGIPELVRQLNQENGITLSTIGVGRDAAPFLPELAELGSGRYHFAADPGSIPTIFTEETTLATRAYIVEETFTPQLANPSPILAGIDALPALEGYVATSPKAAAQPVLVSAQGDPILAAWQYGLGRAVAFTSDASGRWARQWLGWEQFPAFWAQAVSYALRAQTPAGLEVQVEQSGGSARLVVEGQDAAGGFLNGLDLQARITAPDGAVQALELQQTAPGRYEGEFQPGSAGVYAIGVAGSGESEEDAGGTNSVAAAAGWVLSYPAEYRRLGRDERALVQVAELTGGEMLGLESSPASVFRHDLPSGRQSRPIWPELLLLAAILLPFDVASRRLAWEPGQVKRWLAGLAAGFRRQTTMVERPRSERVSTLLAAKERARRGEREETGTTEPGGEPEIIFPGNAVEENKAEKNRTPNRTAGQSREEETGQSTTSALLAAKRRRRKE